MFTTELNLVGISIHACRVLSPLKNTQHNVIHKTRSIQCTARTSEKDRARATGNMHKNLAKFGHVVFELCKQTERHTDILITILCTPPGAK